MPRRGKIVRGRLNQIALVALGSDGEARRFQRCFERSLVVPDDTQKTQQESICFSAAPGALQTCDAA